MKPVLSLSKGEPSGDELAAIAAAYAIVMQRSETACPEPVEGRWRFAARLPDIDIDATDARLVARAASRWNIAGRLDE